MVREEDEPKKRGWFSRKKKSSTSTSHASRPPGPSYASHHRQGSSQSVADDDLPPREGSPATPIPKTPTASTPTVNSPTEEADDGDVTSNLPKHAGFDFKAIKDVIGKADLNPEELQMPAPSRFSAPSIPPPTQRTESAPPPAPEPLSPPPKPRSPLNIPEPPIAGSSSSSGEASPSLARSMSLNDMKAALESEDATSVDEKTPSSSQVFGVPPLPSSSANSPSWLAEVDRTPPLGSSAFNSPFVSNPFETRSRYNPLHSAGMGSYGLSRAPDNAFGPPDSATLSFGGADGSITFGGPSSTETADPWNLSTPSFGAFGSSTKKPSSSFNVNSNPWQS